MVLTRRYSVEYVMNVSQPVLFSLIYVTFLVEVFIRTTKTTW